MVLKRIQNRFADDSLLLSRRRAMQSGALAAVSMMPAAKSLFAQEKNEKADLFKAEPWMNTRQYGEAREAHAEQRANNFVDSEFVEPLNEKLKTTADADYIKTIAREANIMIRRIVERYPTRTKSHHDKYNLLSQTVAVPKVMNIVGELIRQKFPGNQQNATLKAGFMPNLSLLNGIQYTGNFI